GRAGEGGYAPETPEQVLKLLATLARNQVGSEALRLRAARRDCRRTAAAGPEQWAAPARGSSPSQHVAAAELLEKARHVLGPDEWRVVQLRQDGWPWADIAELLGGSAEALRKQLARAMARVSKALGVAEGGHEEARPGECGAATAGIPLTGRAAGPLGARRRGAGRGVFAPTP